MATTLTLNSSIGYAQAFGGFRGLNIGTGNEPALTAGNILLTTILSPPFSWNWNRASASFLTTAGQQDYVVSAANFGFIEKASYVQAASITNTALTSNVATYIAANSFAKGNSVTVAGCTNSSVFNITNQIVVSASAIQFTVAITNGNIGSGAETAGVAVLATPGISGSLTEISEVVNVLGSGAEAGSPAKIAPQSDDNANNITFRILPIPDQVYQINVIFQKRIPSLMSGLSSTWAPIPDHYSFIYQQGFLGLMMAYWNDPRWESVNRKFVASLLGVAEGLNEEQRDVFQAGWLNMVTEQQGRTIQTQQGTQARGSQ